MRWGFEVLFLISANQKIGPILVPGRTRRSVYGATTVGSAYFAKTRETFRKETPSKTPQPLCVDIV